MRVRIATMIAETDVIALCMIVTIALVDYGVDFE